MLTDHTKRMTAALEQWRAALDLLVKDRSPSVPTSQATAPLVLSNQHLGDILGEPVPVGMQVIATNRPDAPTETDDRVVVEYFAGPLHGHQITLPRWYLRLLLDDQSETGILLSEFPDGRTCQPSRYRLHASPDMHRWSLVCTGDIDSVL